MAELIGHEAYREFELLLNSDVDIRDFAVVREWAYKNNKRAIYDWMRWRWDEGYLRGLDEGFEPTTLYFGISTPKQSAGDWTKEPLMLTDEDGTRYLVLFSKFDSAWRYCKEQADLDEFPAKEQQEVTGEIVHPSPARG